MPQYNAKRVMHKFIGMQQSFTDNYGEWQTLGYTSKDTNPKSGTIQYLAINGFIFFRSNLIVNTIQADGSIQLNAFPSNLKNVQIPAGLWPFNASNIRLELQSGAISLTYYGSGKGVELPLSQFRLIYTQ